MYTRLYILHTHSNYSGMSTCFSHRKTYSVTDAASVYANNCISRFEKVDIDCIANAMHGFAKRYVVKSVMKMYILAMFFAQGRFFSTVVP